MLAVAEQLIFITIVVSAFRTEFLAQALSDTTHRISLLGELVQLIHHLLHVATSPTDLALHVGELLLQSIKFASLLAHRSIETLLKVIKFGEASLTLLSATCCTAFPSVKSEVFILLIIIVISAPGVTAIRLLGIGRLELTLGLGFAFLLVLDPEVLVDASSYETEGKGKLEGVAHEPGCPRVLIDLVALLQARLDGQDLAWACLDGEQGAVGGEEIAEVGALVALRQLVDSRLNLGGEHEAELVCGVGVHEVERSIFGIPGDQK